MPEILNLYGATSDPRAVKATAGMLCEFPEDSDWLSTAAPCHTPEELLGSADEALHVAHAMVSKLMAQVSMARELPILSIFEEPMLEQVSYAIQGFHLDRWICSQGFRECRFHGYSAWLDRLQQIRRLSRSNYRLTAEVPVTESSWMRRGMRKVWESHNSPGELFQRLAPVVSRYASARGTRSLTGQAPRGGIWFYSTSYNYTKIGLEYEPFFPSAVHYLVGDPGTAGRGLTERGRGFYPLYAWSRSADIPSRTEVKAIARRINAVLSSVPLNPDEEKLRTVLFNSDFWDNFLKRRLPFLIFHERVLQRWWNAIRPEMLVVGNAGWERAVLHSPVAKHTPSIMLQHGVMHWVYAVADQPVSAFLLRGEFFQRVVNEKLRRKTVICNYPQEIRSASKAEQNSGSDILFITTPYSGPALLHPAELEEILGRLLRLCHSRGRRLVIRVHPMEKIAAYQRLVDALQRQADNRVEVLYSQGPGAEEVLTHSCVAVLYFSTMFLDCLRHGIPIISFGWHWFPNKRHYEAEQIFNFARNLGHFEELLNAALAGKLRSRRDGLETFLASTQAEDVSRLLAQIWESRSRVEATAASYAAGASCAD